LLIIIPENRSFFFRVLKTDFKLHLKLQQFSVMLVLTKPLLQCRKYNRPNCE